MLSLVKLFYITIVAFVALTSAVPATGITGTETVQSRTDPNPDALEQAVSEQFNKAIQECIPKLPTNTDGQRSAEVSAMQPFVLCTISEFNNRLAKKGLLESLVCSILRNVGSLVKGLPLAGPILSGIIGYYEKPKF